jgi:TonB family protein
MSNSENCVLIYKSQEDFKMRRKIFFTLFCIFVFGFGVVSAQVTEDKGSGGGRGTAVGTGVGVSKGVLNGAAISLVKPAYPPAAKAVKAEGVVSVQVIIDEEGNVVSAEAVGGHPLLRAASVNAALQSKFKPTLLEGQPVKVTGIVVYNFVVAPSPLSMRRIGYTLSLAESSLWWNDSSPEEIANSLPAEWKEEKETLKNLETYIKNKEEENLKAVEKARAAAPNEQTKSVGTFKIGAENLSASGVRASTPAGFYKPLDAESAEKLRALQSKIESRLPVSDKELWSFRLGKLLGKTKAEIEDNDKTRANLSELDQLMQVTPYQFAESVSSEIREISESYRQSSASAEMRARLEKLIGNLSK